MGGKICRIESRKLIKLKSLLIVLALLDSTTAGSAGLLDKEIHFSEADIQAQVEKSGSLQKSYGNGMIVIALV